MQTAQQTTQQHSSTKTVILKALKDNATMVALVGLAIVP